MQGGVALLDADADGWLDAFLVQSGPLPPVAGGGAGDRLWRNRGDGTFEERTAAAGLGADDDYGSGAAAADYDGDGDVDLYVTNLGANRLWRNRGDGTFEDVTARAGVGDPRYSTSAAFLDYDSDGDLDLFVCNYLEWSPQLEKVCLGPMGLRGYCRPAEYAPQPASLYRNDGDGTFTDVSRSAGIAARASTGLGVVAADFDRDGRVDIYVANDQRPNFLWMNNGDGTFREEALERGCALSGMGFAQAGMGVAVADPEGDGDWDLFVVNLSGEGSTYYRNAGDGNFLDATDELGLGSADAAVHRVRHRAVRLRRRFAGSTYSSPTARWCPATAWRCSSRARGRRNEHRSPAGAHSHRRRRRSTTESRTSCCTVARAAPSRTSPRDRAPRSRAPRCRAAPRSATSTTTATSTC